MGLDLNPKDLSEIKTSLRLDLGVIRTFGFRHLAVLGKSSGK